MIVEKVPAVTENSTDEAAQQACAGGNGAYGFRADCAEGGHVLSPPRAI